MVLEDGKRAASVIDELDLEICKALTRANKKKVDLSILNIVDKTGIPHNSLKKHLDKLEDMQIIKRKVKPKDRKIYIVYDHPKTDKGVMLSGEEIGYLIADAVCKEINSKIFFRHKRAKNTLKTVSKL